MAASTCWQSLSALSKYSPCRAGLYKTEEDAIIVNNFTIQK
jgi:hypothetical protein